MQFGCWQQVKHDETDVMDVIDNLFLIIGQPPLSYATMHALPLDTYKTMMHNTYRHILNSLATL